MTRAARLLPALVGLLLLTGCAGEPSATEEPAPAGSTTTSSAEPGTEATPSSRDEDQPVPETLDFTATTVSGDPFAGASLAGRPVLLWFWAPWCPTCRSQIPQVQGLAEQYGDEVAVVGVGSLDSAEAIAAFAEEVDGVTHLEDLDGALYRKFGIAEQSSFVLLDADGVVAFETGYGGSDELAAEVADVVG